MTPERFDALRAWFGLPDLDVLAARYAQGVQT